MQLNIEDDGYTKDTRVTHRNSVLEEMTTKDPEKRDFLEDQGRKLREIQCQ